jgi:hypothetical protein
MTKGQGPINRLLTGAAMNNTTENSPNHSNRKQSYVQSDEFTDGYKKAIQEFSISKGQLANFLQLLRQNNQPFFRWTD